MVGGRTGPSADRAFPVLLVALAAGLWTHYFAILAFVPIGIGELVRLRSTRKIDYVVAAAAACALVAALPLRAVMPAAAMRAATFWSRASLSQIGPTYAFLFAPLLSTSVLIALGIVIGLALIELLPAIARQRTVCIATCRPTKSRPDSQLWLSRPPRSCSACSASARSSRATGWRG